MLFRKVKDASERFEVVLPVTYGTLREFANTP